MYPYNPRVLEGANCGPTVLAGILECHTSRAMDLLRKHNEKGWHGYTNINHIRNVLKALGGTFIKVTIDDIYTMFAMKKLQMTALFLQIKGPWVGHGWWNEYTHTHWVLIQFGYCLDVNNPVIQGDKIMWIPIEDWKTETMPRVVGSYKDGNGWELRGAYIAELKL